MDMMSKKVAVLQPSYLPWAGVFALIDQVDTFVFYDDVQFEKQSWQQRNRIKTVNGVQWLTVPIERQPLGSKINEIMINYNTDWRKNHWRSLEQSYSKTPFFNLYETFWVDFYKVKFLYLGEMNIYLTRVMAEGFNLRIPAFKRSSDFKLEGNKTERLISLLKQLNATEYVSGMAARNYIREDKFTEAGIKLTWFNYSPQSYPQLHGQFVPYLSAIDLLFNTGEESIKYIRSGNGK